jgi:hypothetical protein
MGSVLAAGIDDHGTLAHADGSGEVHEHRWSPRFEALVEQGIGAGGKATMAEGALE